MMSVMLEAALRSLILALAVWAGLRVFRVRNVVAQKVAWGLVLAAALLMPFLAPRIARLLPAYASIQLPLSPVAQPAQSTQIEPMKQIIATHRFAEPAPTAAAIAKPSPAHAVDPSRRTLVSEGSAAVLDAPQAGVTSVYTGAPVAAHPVPPPPAEQAPISISIASLAGWLYLGVAAALLLRLFYGLATALHLLFTAEPIRSKQGAHSADGIALRVSRAVSSPVTIGSAVVLPADYVDWEAEKLRIVLAHERSHIRQGDFYLQILAGLYAALVWFSPLGWWLKRELSDLAETISDRAGLEQAASTTAYAQILLEFAAAPRPTVLGVAMARTGSLSRRIERLLNDNAFRQAFAGGRRRILVAFLLVPVALLGVTALVRVQAAQDAPSANATPAAQPTPAVQPAPAAQPAPAPQAAAQADPKPVAAPVPDADDSEVVIHAGGPAAPELVGPVTAPAAPPAPPAVGVTVIRPGAVELIAPPKPLGPRGPMAPMVRLAPGEMHLYALAQDDASKGSRRGYHYRYMIDDDSYAIIRGNGNENMTFSGEMHTGDIDKARKLAHGDFLWFERNDKQYFVDDPAILAQIEAMYKPMEDLGKQQEELGRQQEELGKQQEALGEKQEQASVPTPDMRKEMAELTEAMAKLQAKIGKTVTQEELGELQDKLGDLQGRLGEIQGEIGSKQGELGAQQGKLGAEQGRLGAQQGKLGAEQGRLARDADRKVRSIIDESLQNGKAHPVN